MLEIHPIEDKKEQELVCRVCKMTYDADSLCYAAYVDEVLTAASQFRIEGQCGIVSDIVTAGDTKGDNALFILGRATLNFIDLCEVHSAKYTGSNCDETLLMQIGYKKNDDGEWAADLEGFFDSPCQQKS